LGTHWETLQTRRVPKFPRFLKKHRANLKPPVSHRMRLQAGFGSREDYIPRCIWRREFYKGPRYSKELFYGPLSHCWRTGRELPSKCGRRPPPGGKKLSARRLAIAKKSGSPGGNPSFREGPPIFLLTTRRAC